MLLFIDYPYVEVGIFFSMEIVMVKGGFHAVKWVRMAHTRTYKCSENNYQHRPVASTTTAHNFAQKIFRHEMAWRHTFSCLNIYQQYL